MQLNICICECPAKSRKWPNISLGKDYPKLNFYGNKMVPKFQEGRGQ